MVGT
jgi:hypothetical protein